MSGSGIETGPTSAERLGVLIKDTQAVLHQRMDERLRPLGLSVAQYACLQALADEPGVTGSELARRTFVSRQSMNVLLQGLEKRGLVERAVDPGGRRERSVQLTARAQELIIRARGEVAGIAEVMTGELSDGEAERLHAMLTSCRDALLEA
jgi:DNA-binding MarR family transcriptional regulator